MRSGSYAMLSDSDIEMIKEARKEVYENRTTTIQLVVEKDDVKDPITGFPVAQEPDVYACEAIVTEPSALTRIQNTLVESGISLEKGDVFFDVDYEELPDPDIKPQSIRYRGMEYEIISAPHKGLGELNRIEFLGRRRS